MKSQKLGRTRTFINYQIKLCRKGGFSLRETTWQGWKHVSKALPNSLWNRMTISAQARSSSHQGHLTMTWEGTAETVEEKDLTLQKHSRLDTNSVPHRQSLTFPRQHKDTPYKAGWKKNKGWEENIGKTVWWRHLMATGAFPQNYSFQGKLILWHFQVI